MPHDVIAVIPAAGSGTRLLPITKALPKEMLPLVDQPLVHYAVEEAVECGIRDLVIITGHGGEVIKNYFAAGAALEPYLHNPDLLISMGHLPHILETLTIGYAEQSKPLGLGHAILVSEGLVRDRALAVLLVDDVILSRPSCLEQLLAVYRETGESVIGLFEVPDEDVQKYGIALGERVDLCPGLDVLRLKDVIEKPKRKEAPSRLSVMGRYVLRPELFRCLDELKPGTNGEIQLTDGIRRLMGTRPVYGVVFRGSRVDAGERNGYVRATIEIALRRRPELGLREYLSEVLGGRCQGS